MRTRFNPMPFLLALVLTLTARGQTTRPALDGATITVEQDGKARRYKIVADEPAPPANPPTAPTPVSAVANFAILNTTGVAPALVSVHAFSLPAESYDPMTTRCTWTFGDPAGAYDTLSGFNAAHVYDKPGTYTITLSLEKADGSRVAYTRSVRIAPDNRPRVHVSSDGDDQNPGTVEQPIKSLAVAERKSGDSTAVLLRRGDVFPTGGSFVVKGADVLIGSYGDANSPKPVILYNGGLGSTPVVRCTGQTNGLIVQDVTFDSVYDKDTEKKGMPDCVLGAGQNILVRDVTFLNVGYGFNGNGYPMGVMIQDCDAPSPTGIRSYLAWIQGRDQVIVGNTCVNSTREHVIRCNGFERLLIAFNDFTNRDRTDVDKYDTAKGALVIQSGKYVWADDNHLRGSAGVGPLGDKDGLTHPETRTQFAVVERNFFDTHSFVVAHGAEHVIFRDNRIEATDDRSIEVDGFAKSYNRGVVDLTIRGNLAVNRGTKGGFLAFGGPADGITVEENTYIAPLLSPGSHATAIIYVVGSDLTGFRSIARNTWPAVKTQNYAKGGVMYVWPKWSDSKGYLTPAAWAALPCVKDDVFKALPLPRSATTRATTQETEKTE